MEDPDYQIGSDEMKRTLKKENRLYKTALDHEVDELKDQVNQIGKIALIAGGAMLGTYLLYRLLKKSDKKDDCVEEQAVNNYVAVPKSQIVTEKPKKESSFGAIIKEQLALVAVSLIREKLNDLINQDKRKIEEKRNDLTGKA